MDYFVVFLGGFLVGVLITLSKAMKRETAAIAQLRKELNLPEAPPPIPVSYAKAEDVRRQYGSMWGPQEKREE